MQDFPRIEFYFSHVVVKNYEKIYNIGGELIEIKAIFNTLQFQREISAFAKIENNSIEELDFSGRCVSHIKVIGEITSFFIVLLEDYKKNSEIHKLRKRVKELEEEIEGIYQDAAGKDL